MIVNPDCQLYCIERYLENWYSTLVGVSVFPEMTGICVSELEGKTFPECGWHLSIGWGPVWDKKQEGTAHMYAHP